MPARASTDGGTIAHHEQHLCATSHLKVVEDTLGVGVQPHVPHPARLRLDGALGYAAVQLVPHDSKGIWPKSYRLV